MFFVIFWTALVRYTWLSNSSRFFFSDNQYFRMFLVSMADIIGSYERLPNDAVRAVAVAKRREYVDTHTQTHHMYLLGLLCWHRRPCCLGWSQWMPWSAHAPIWIIKHQDQDGGQKTCPDWQGGMACNVFWFQSPPCLVQAPFHAAKALHWSSKVTKYVASQKPKTVSVGALLRKLVCRSLLYLFYELISAANSALSVIALAKWILPNQVFYWIPSAAVGTSRSYNNSRPSCYNNSFLPVKQPGDLAKVSQTPHSLETVASDYTNKADQPRIVRHSWDYWFERLEMKKWTILEKGRSEFMWKNMLTRAQAHHMYLLGLLCWHRHRVACAKPKKSKLQRFFEWKQRLPKDHFMGGEISYMHLLARVLSPLLQPHHAPNCLTALFHLGLGGRPCKIWFNWFNCCPQRWRNSNAASMKQPPTHCRSLQTERNNVILGTGDQCQSPL